MKRFISVTLWLVCVAITLAEAKVVIWDPNQDSTVFHSEYIEVQWSCSDNDTICETGPIDLRLYQDGSSKLVSPITPMSRGPTSIVWAVPPIVPEGDNFYFKAYHGDAALGADCPRFSIRHAGLQIISPSVSTVWIANVPLVVTFKSSPLFSDKNRTLDIVMTDGQSYRLKLGEATAADGVFQVPWRSFPWKANPGFYRVFIRMNNQILATSSRFILASDAKSACDDFSLAALFSAGAYEELHQDNLYDTCGQVWKSVFVYNEGDNGAMVVASETSKVAVVAFRGTTQSITDWMNTLAVIPIRCNGLLHAGCHGGFIHAGFGLSFNHTRDAIRVVSYNLVKQGYRLIVTGHSKGGAVAAIQATDLLQAFSPDITPSTMKLITFGQPRVGDENFVATLNSLLPSSKCNSIRFVGRHAICGTDPVSGLPPKGFWHHGGESIYVPCSASCLKRGALGLALKCHFIDNYVQEVVVQNLGHSVC